MTLGERGDTDFQERTVEELVSMEGALKSCMYVLMVTVLPSSERV